MKKSLFSRPPRPSPPIMACFFSLNLSLSSFGCVIAAGMTGIFVSITFSRHLIPGDDVLVIPDHQLRTVNFGLFGRNKVGIVCAFPLDKKAQFAKLVCGSNNTFWSHAFRECVILWHYHRWWFTRALICRKRKKRQRINTIIKNNM